MISLSLQSGAPQSPFQRTPVRPSTPRYGRFSLAPDSSLGLRVHPGRLSAPFGLAFAAARSPLTSPPGVTRGLIMQKANGHGPGPAPIACGRAISGLFHSPPGVLFTFPSRYWSTIGHRVVLSLGGWSPLLRAGFRVPRPTRDAAGGRLAGLRGSHPVPPGFPAGSAASPPSPGAVPQPRGACAPVWALALSLAATRAVSFDFLSSGY